MKVISAEFIKSAFDRSHWLSDPRPEIAFLGRSNVGKSSLINSLLGRRGLARTSSSPGRTQSINFFLINDAFYFADLPGYGYAKVSKAMRADWGKMAEDYLRDREQLALCVHLVDSRHEPTALDKQLNEWLVVNKRPFVVAATKTDKLSANELSKSLRTIRKTFDGAEIVAFSAESGRGRDDLWAVIGRAAADF
ncbi:MAG TPA: ribosome biogenesis GTP-binding protein YihA/YsxC [Pyrinomonadaceae bacterium]|nr:ribosome biogenesis GTP-binding protein YihA/YsxC [Pyrinomonadaceae bacterium]